MEGLSRRGKVGWELNAPIAAGILTRQIRSEKAATSTHRLDERQVTRYSGTRAWQVVTN